MSFIQTATICLPAFVKITVLLYFFLSSQFLHISLTSSSIVYTDSYIPSTCKMSVRCTTAENVALCMSVIVKMNFADRVGNNSALHWCNRLKSFLSRCLCFTGKLNVQCVRATCTLSLSIDHYPYSVHLYINCQNFPINYLCLTKCKQPLYIRQ